MTALVARTKRNEAIDLLRGVAMVLMALDHARDFYCGFGSATDLETTTPALFMTRWVTHFCAPIFVFLAGTAAYLYGAKKTKNELSRFLFTRGLWLIALELTIVRFGWVPEPFYRFTLLQVIWAIGWAMVALSALSRLPLSWVLTIGVAIVAGHDAFAPIDAADLGSGGWLFSVLLEPGRYEPLAGRVVMVSYPILPWIGVMACGFAFGQWMREAPEERARRSLHLGLALTSGFVALRASGLYGDPTPWAVQPDPVFTVLSFLNCSKYPPSLLFLLMTLGPALMLLAWLERAPLGTGARTERWLLKPLLVFGRVPLFYYVAHLYLLRFTAAGMSYWRYGLEAFTPPPGPAASPQWPLWAGYLAWVAALVLLYPVSRWFAGVKRRRSDWWLSYL